MALAAAPASAENDRRGYASLRYDEDWRALCDPARRTQPFDAVKCRDTGGGTTLTLGGELRERFEAVRNPVFGLAARGSDRVLLHRLLVHADWRAGDAVRVFVQLADRRATTRGFGNPPTDRDAVDLAQGFLDLGVGGLTLRAGRQELDLGSGRLVAVRDGANIRRAFDGGRASWRRHGWRIDALFLQPVAIAPAAFDDGTDTSQALWGGYATTPPLAGVGQIDFYYLGLRRNRGVFAAGTARELRHSFGARWFGKRDGVDWDIEAVVQAGRFGADRIAAWTLASNLGWRVAAPLRLGLKADIASGDARPGDGRLGTFNALYPKLPYFTEANLVAPANLMDLQPGVTVTPAPRLELAASIDLLWKHRRADAFYAPPLTPIAATRGGGRWIGWQASLSANWRVTPRLTLRGAYVRFAPGAAIRAAGGRAGDFVMTSVAIKF
ncbi:hypothetical protein IP88_02565 [alpha proteobacterium AAP81b]|nr:hypothetical protein IP88_02565 [alpha proteobacterium AAP81b]